MRRVRRRGTEGVGKGRSRIQYRADVQESMRRKRIGGKW